MKNNIIIRQASEALTNGERELLFFLTDRTAKKQDIISFLNRYDIDQESAASSFLMNELIDRFCLEEQDSPIIPRIKGLKNFFHFHNAAVMARLSSDEVILDPDLYLKIRFPDKVRPFTMMETFLSKRDSYDLFGGKFTDRLLSDTVLIKVQRNVFTVPDEKHLLDMLYFRLYLSLRVSQRGGDLLLYLYDLDRYCSGRTPGADAAGFTGIQGIQE